MFPQKAIGIDLGTSYSCVGVWQKDHVEIIANDQGDQTTPSCVAFTDSKRLIGDAAMSQATRNPSNTIFNVKRLIGRAFDDYQVQNNIQHFPFKVISKNNRPWIEVNHRGENKLLSPEEVSSMILSKMKRTAEAFLGTTVTNCVVTVPVYFNDSQRQATRDAASICGLNTLRVIDESSAAAVAFSLDQNVTGEHRVLMCDFGGGGLSVSFMVIEENIVEIKAVAGDPHLGGEAFDDRLTKYFIEEFRTKHKTDLTTNFRAVRRLRTACERAKRTLSSARSASIEIDSLHMDFDLYSFITRAQFEAICHDLFQRVLDPIERVLRDSKVGKFQVDEIVLLGGCSRIPRIGDIIVDFFGRKELNKSFQTSEAVTRGAAIQAAILSGNTTEKLYDLLLLDVFPVSLGIETDEGMMIPMLPRNTCFPTKKSEIVSMSACLHDQKFTVLIQVYEGERARTKDNHLLGTLTLSGLPPFPSTDYKHEIEITFDLDPNGVLIVSASEKSSGCFSSFIVINDKYRLSKMEKERMMLEAEMYDAEEEVEYERIAAMNHLQDYSYKIHNSIAKIKAQLQAALDETILWLEDSQEASKEEYEEKQKELEELFNPILQRFSCDGFIPSHSSTYRQRG
ncbi:hypothetical protein GYMLUDRAFT_337577 [Collybiopsis luxurians FD-317 M1]|nr:hypothetical protein GYMLUDRAFT_337577 [Collybiopsis luxurians FD-317 M1]